MPENTKRNAMCPFIVRELHLKDISLLESGRLRDYVLTVGSKRLAEAVAEADGRASPTLKRARNESSASLASMTTSSVDSLRYDEITDAVLGLTRLCRARV
jgi:hypothetical protein